MPTIEPVTPQLHLSAFTGYGIELEYMIVDAGTLKARPLAERLLTDESGQVCNEIVDGELAWSNELVAHVIELKTNGPAASLDGLPDQFAQAIGKINHRLQAEGAMLLPTAMHPLFFPHTDTVLWPHGQNEIYAAYDRIFGCRGHGWSNLQSMHINLPFANDDEFRRLHAAIRVVLPLLPALAASSPYEEGHFRGWQDRRLYHYRNNQTAVPEIVGLGVPEAVNDIADYHRRILEPMYAAIARHDPDGILADDWLNSRGAIARFERQTIEIRLIDLQECPAADLAIADAVIRLVRRLFDAGDGDFARYQALKTGELSRLLFSSAEHGDDYLVEDRKYLQALGLEQPASGLGIWRALVAGGLMQGSPHKPVFDRILARGNLASALIRRLGGDPGVTDLTDCYRELARCLCDNQLFQP